MDKEYEQGPDDAEVKKIEDLYKRGQYVCEECVEHCEHTLVFFLLDALRAERAKVAELENRRGDEFEKYVAAMKEYHLRAESAESIVKTQGEALAAAEKALEYQAEASCDGAHSIPDHTDPKGYGLALNALAKLRAAKEGA